MENPGTWATGLITELVHDAWKRQVFNSFKTYPGVYVPRPLELYVSRSRPLWSGLRGKSCPSPNLTGTTLSSMVENRSRSGQLGGWEIFSNATLKADALDRVFASTCNDPDYPSNSCRYSPFTSGSSILQAVPWAALRCGDFF